jgi:hypothetical protein
MQLGCSRNAPMFSVCALQDAWNWMLSTCSKKQFPAPTPTCWPYFRVLIRWTPFSSTSTIGSTGERKLKTRHNIELAKAIAAAIDKHKSQVMLCIDGHHFTDIKALQRIISEAIDNF